MPRKKKVKKVKSKSRVVKQVKHAGEHAKHIGGHVTQHVKNMIHVGKNLPPLKTRFVIALKNLILFIVLFVLSIVLYSLSRTPIYKNFFLITSIVLGFVAVAYLIIFLIFVFMRAFNK